MAKWSSDQYLDGSLDILVNNATRMAASEGQPAVLTEITNPKGTADGKRISDEVVMSSGDFPKSDGAVDGRKIDVATKTDVPVATGVTGTPDHVALYSPTVLYYVTTVSSPPTGIDDQDTLNFSSWRITHRDPT